jgi:chromosome segregation ATPase
VAAGVAADENRKAELAAAASTIAQLRVDVASGLAAAQSLENRCASLTQELRAVRQSRDDLEASYNELKTAAGSASTSHAVQVKHLKEMYDLAVQKSKSEHAKQLADVEARFESERQASMDAMTAMHQDALHNSIAEVRASFYVFATAMSSVVFVSSRSTTSL